MEQIPISSPQSQPQPVPPSQPNTPSVKSPPNSLYYWLVLAVLGVFAIAIPLVLYPLASKTTYQPPLPTPTPPFTIRNVIPAITSTDQSVQNTLATMQNNLTVINQLGSATTASSTATTLQKTLKQTIQILSDENQRVITLSKTLDPLVNASSNSAELTKTIVDLNNQTGDIKNTLAVDASLITLIIPTSSTIQKNLTTILKDFTQIQADFTNIRTDLAKLRTGFFTVPSQGPLPCTPPPACVTAHPRCEIAEPAGGWCLSPTPSK